MKLRPRLLPQVLVPIYLGELAPPVLRGFFGTCTLFAMVIGILVANVLAFPLARARWWRALFGVTALCAAAQLRLARHLPETPRWLLDRDPESAEAHVVLKRLYGFRDDEQIELEKLHILDANARQTRRQREFSPRLRGVVGEASFESASTDASDEAAVDGVGCGGLGDSVEGVCDLLADRSVRLLLVSCVGLHLAQQLCGINAVFYYSTSFFEGVIANPLLGTTLVSCVNVLAVALAQHLMDAHGRRGLLLWSSGGMLAGALLLTLALRGAVPRVVALAAVMIFVVFFGIGLGPIPWLIVAEMFEGEATSPHSRAPLSRARDARAPLSLSRARARGCEAPAPRPFLRARRARAFALQGSYLEPAQSLACQLNWIANFVVGLAFPFMSEWLGEWAFMPFAFVLVGVFGFALLFLPETLGRTPQEIKQLVNGPILDYVQIGGLDRSA